MTTVKQIYTNAGTLLRSDRKVYEMVRENIEKLVIKEEMYKWEDEVTQEMMDRFFLNV